MSHSCETAANAALEALAALDASGKLGADERIVPGVHPTWDGQEGTVALSYQSGGDNLLRLDATVTGWPRWLTLNLDLGVGAFEAGDVIGLVAEVAGDRTYDLDMFIRSDSDQGAVDTELREPLRVTPEPCIAAALHSVAASDDMSGRERFHMLGIRLPKQDFRLDVRALRVFVRPASEAPDAPTLTLAGTAG